MCFYLIKSRSDVENCFSTRGSRDDVGRRRENTTERLNCLVLLLSILDRSRRHRRKCMVVVGAVTSRGER